MGYTRMFSLVLLALISSVASQDCAISPAEWLTALDAALNGGAFKCAGEDLMIRFDTLGGNDDPPVALSKYGNFWAWASGKDSLDVYMQMAMDIGDRKQFTSAIMKYVGFDNTDVDDLSKYILTVFSRTEMGNSAPFHPFTPTWTDLFAYFYSFEVCFYHGSEDLCEEQPWSVQFAGDVKTNLTNLAVDQTTDCDQYFGDTGCSLAFSNMEHDLLEARGDSTLHPRGVLAATLKYMNYVGSDGAAIPMGEMIDDQARAFFEVALGATWLFTGNGFSNNGDADTGKEWIVRGDSPMEKIGGVRYQLYP